jgi:basic amino acid/polyamine antiporter, APA family
VQKNWQSAVQLITKYTMNSSTKETSAGEGQLGVWDAISIIVGIVIGTTIYMVPQLIFSNVENPRWGLLVWIFGGLLALIGAFCYAELATTYPKAGGDYYYLTKAFGPATGFLFGWAQLTVVIPASIGVMAYVFADFFLKEFFRNVDLVFEVPVRENVITLDPHFAIATMVVSVLALTNIVGVFLGKIVQNLLTFAKIVGLSALIICGLGWPGVKEGAWASTHEPTTPLYFGTLAIILVMYAYGGWNDSAFVAAEVRNPKRNIPLALFAGVAVIVAVYVLVNAAYINSVGWDKIVHFDWANDPTLPRQVIDASPLSKWGGDVMSIIVMVSALGAVNGLTFTGARVYATLGADHRLFGWMGYWRPGHGTPIMALILQALLTVFIVGAIATEHGHEAVNQGLEFINKGLAGANQFVQKIDENLEIPPIDYEKEWKPGDGFERLVARTAPVFWTFFLMTGLSLFVLREKFKDMPRPFSVPLYPIVPLIFCNSCAWMLYQATDFVRWHALFAVVIVLLGLPLYWLSRLISGPPRDEPLDIGMPASLPPARPLQRPKS